MEIKEQEKKQAFENLLEFKKILDKMNIEFMLDGGTLLGAYRDKDFCEDDHDDIDLTTLCDHKKAIDILEEAGAKEFELYHYWQKDNEKVTAQIAVRKDGMKIDLMFKEVMIDKKKQTQGWWTVFGGPNKITYKSVPAVFYLRTKEIDFKGVKFLIPDDAEGYLIHRYGNWKTPIHRREFSCFKTDLAIKKSYEDL